LSIFLSMEVFVALMSELQVELQCTLIAAM
jgi:hypothetical protein